MSKMAGWAGFRKRRTRPSGQLPVYVDPLANKADSGLLFGWAIVSKIDDIPYYDLQGDHISESGMLKAATRYVEGSRRVEINHNGKLAGKVVFAFPLTSEIAASMGISSACTGLMIGWRPHDPALLDRFQSGELTGLSVGLEGG
ncbi:XkdF-like putative serine protease domain-containing protein [Mesorhizobium yinganensis]|uniref:XkdF-like putative serine protease domain-containing protein n=1 Tax=Mesorhizobium yinganensis TaxID=3157707 RepID=UPI0032B85C7A